MSAYASGEQEYIIFISEIENIDKLNYHKWLSKNNTEKIGVIIVEKEGVIKDVLIKGKYISAINNILTSTSEEIKTLLLFHKYKQIENIDISKTDIEESMKINKKTLQIGTKEFNVRAEKYQNDYHNLRKERFDLNNIKEIMDTRAMKKKIESNYSYYNKKEELIYNFIELLETSTIDGKNIFVLNKEKYLKYLKNNNIN